MNRIVFPPGNCTRQTVSLIRAVILAALATFPWVVPSWAIGPHTQTVDPTLDGVVRVLYDNPPQQNPGDGYFNGTGTIIGNHNVDGRGWLCVLTADHVLSSTGNFGGALVSRPGIAFSNSAQASGNSPYLDAGPRVRRNGANGTSDLAVMGVRYGAFSPAYDALVRNVVPATAFFFFSDIGYGDEGRLLNVDGMGGPDGYQAQGVYGTERYLNDKIGTFQANFSFIGYTYEAAHWFVENPADPGAIQGSGTTFGADSGSPYFSSELMTDLNNDIFEFYTNNLFAVHTGPAATQQFGGMPYKPFGFNNFGVALTGADVEWIHESCDYVVVPEPTTVVLIFVGIAAIALGRGRPMSR